MITDCHTHWGMGWAERDGEDPSNWLAVLDRHGVDRAFICGHAGLMNSEQCPADNDLLARVAARAPHRLVPFGTCPPRQEETCVAEARRCLDKLGMRGIKLHPWLQGFSTAVPAMDELCRLAAARGAPVMFHDGTPCYALTEQILGLAHRFPETRFILGHSGLLWNWRSALGAAQMNNVWVCLCGPHQRAMEILCRHIPPRRLLWGSDFGFSFADAIEYRLNLLRRARIGVELRERILGDNPVELRPTRK